MRYGMRSIQKKPILSHLIGALLGAMSVLKYSVPVVFVGASLIFGVRQWSIWSAKSASGVILFCVTALTLDFYHDGFEFIRYGTTHALIIIAIIATPLAGLFLLNLSQQEQIEQGLLFGSYGAIFLMSLDQYYFGQCRVSGFFFENSINPLLITFSLTPIVLFTTLARLEAGRYNTFDFVLCVLLLPATGALAGHRAAFYTLIIIYVLVGLFFLFKSRKKAALFLAVLVIGNSLTVLSDTYSGCNFLKRVGDQAPLINFFEIFETTIEKFENTLLPLAMSPAYAETSLTLVSSEKVSNVGNHEIVETIPDLEASSAWRIRLWARFFDFVSSEEFNWIIGEGRKAERAITPPYSHFHNQFWSVIVQGGLIKILAALLIVMPLLKEMLVRPSLFAFILMYAGQFMSNSPLLNSASLPQFLISVLFVTCAIQVKNRNSHNAS